jgi:hypothetical protein
MPLVDLFLTLMWFFLFVAWVWIVVSVIVDIFRSHDLSGWAKALWVLLVAFIPWLGVFIYLIARGRSMAERARRWAFSEGEPPEKHRGVVGPAEQPSPADELAKLAKLHTAGVLSDAEFEAQKAKILARP